jgi:hypothetical protein
MRATGRGKRSARNVGRAAVIGAAVAVAVLGSVVSVWASASPPAPGRGAPRVAHAAAAGAPAGWAPVPYRNAQLSVPGPWLVESPQLVWCGFSHSGGMIFAGARPEIPKGLGCRLTASVAWILPAGPIRKAVAHRRPTAVIHGIPVYRLHSGQGSVLYLVPDLGVQVGARGPLAQRVLATLTRSPLSVVLRRGPAGHVPATWTWRRFGGIRFATPRSWSLQREDQWATCGTGLEEGTLLLVDATKPPMPLPCPAQLPIASADQAQPGLTVVTGKYAADSVGQGYASCQVRHGVRICLSTLTGQGGIFGGVLVFTVARPHQHVASFLILGLSGSGAGARATFDSIRLAAH